MKNSEKQLLRRICSIVLTVIMVFGSVVAAPVVLFENGITANAASDMIDGGTVKAGETATVTCKGYAAWQLTNLIFESEQNTIGKITKYDITNDVSQKEINGYYYDDFIMCDGGTKFIITVYEGSVNIQFNTANAPWPSIEIVTNTYPDQPGTNPYGDKTEKELCAYFKKPENWDVDSIHTYIYTAGDEKVVTKYWPGDKMENIGNDIYRYSFQHSRTDLRIMFNNGSDGEGNQYPGPDEEGFVFENNGLYTVDGINGHYSNLDPEAYRFFYSKDVIEPGDIVVVGADKLGGNFNGRVFNSVKVDWEISDREVIDFIPIHDKETGTDILYETDKTQLHLKAKNFGKSDLILKLNGVVVCSETIDVVLTDDKLITDYMDNVFSTNVMTILQNSVNLGIEIIDNYDSDYDMELISLITLLKEDLGIKLVVNDFLPFGNMKEDAVDDVIMSFMKEYLKTEEFLNGTVSSFNSKYKKFSKLSKAASFVNGKPDITKIVNELSKETGFSVNKLSKLYDKLNKQVSYGLEVADMLCTAVMIASIDRDAVCQLMSVIGCGNGYMSAEYKGLSRLLDKIDDLDTYVVTKYLGNNMKNAFVEITEYFAMGNSVKIPKAIVGIMTTLYSLEGGKTADDFLKVYSALNIASFTKFGFKNMKSSIGAELAFGMYKSAVKNFISYSIGLADVKGFSNIYVNGDRFAELKAIAKRYNDLIDYYCTYEIMITEAKRLTNNQSLLEYIPDRAVELNDISSRYNVNTGEFELVRSTSTGAGSGSVDEEKPDLNDYLFIPSAIEYNRVISIADHGFENITNKKGVIFPDTIESVGDYAFTDSTSVESVLMNKSITAIGNYAFLNCTSLIDVMIPENVKAIGNSAFENCTSLRYIAVNADDLGDGAFRNCSSLSEIRFNNRDTVIDENVFEGCSDVLIITGYKDSTSEKYAAEHNIAFEAIPEYVDSLSIETPAQKTEYNVGDEIDTTGLTLRAVYEDGTSELISDGWIICNDTSESGIKKVVIIYGEKSVSYDITVANDVSLEISADENEFEMLYGTGMQLKTEIITDSEYKPQIIHTSSDPHIAEVSMTGYLKALRPGKVQVTAKTINGDAEQVFDITITNKSYLSEDDFIIFVPQNDNYYLFTLSADEMDSDILIYDDFDIEVSKTKVYEHIWSVPLEKGVTYTLKTIGDKGTDDNILIDEYVPAKEVKFVDENENVISELHLKKGETKKIISKPVLKNSIEENYYWETDDKSIAIIDEEGNITCLSPGKTTIRVKTSHFAEKELSLFVIENTSMGDVNSDEAIDIADALMVARYDAGLAELDENQVQAGNVNGDDQTDIADALMIARYDAGLITDFT